MRLNTDPAQIQSVSIPAGADGGLALGVAVAMQSHGLAQVLKLAGAELNQYPLMPQAQRKVGGALPVQWVTVVVMALAVVEVGEPGNDRGVYVERSGDTPPVIPDATPVRDTVDAVVKIQPERRANDGKRLTDDVSASRIGVSATSAFISLS